MCRTCIVSKWLTKECNFFVNCANKCQSWHITCFSSVNGSTKAVKSARSGTGNNYSLPLKDRSQPRFSYPRTYAWLLCLDLFFVILWQRSLLQLLHQPILHLPALAAALRTPYLPNGSEKPHFMQTIFQPGARFSHLSSCSPMETFLMILEFTQLLLPMRSD